MFHRFFSIRDSKDHNFQVLFLLIIRRTDRLAEIRWSVRMLKSDIIIIIIIRVFFTSVLADGFSLEFEWQQVSSSLLDSSQDSGHS